MRANDTIFTSCYLWACILPRWHPLILQVQVWQRKSSQSFLPLNSLKGELSLPLASSKLVILWLGLNPWRAPIRLVFPPERAPRGSAPVGVKPFNCSTCSDSSLHKYLKNLNNFYHVKQELHSAYLDMYYVVFICFTSVLRRPWPSSRSPWSCSWSPLSFVELDLNSEDRLTKTRLAASGRSTTSAHRQLSVAISHFLAVRIIQTMEEKSAKVAC